MRWVRTLCFIGALIMASMTMAPIGSVGAQDTSETGTATVDDGSEFPIVAGDTVAQGDIVTENGKQYCNMPKTTIGASGDASTPSFSITAQVTEDCQLVITSITKNHAEGAGSPTAAVPADYRSGGWYDQYDCCGLLLTESYADMYYSDDGGSVYGGYSPYTYCHNALDGWYGVWSAWDWSPDGPSSVSIWKECEFAYVGGSYDHTLEVNVYSWPGDAYDVYCSHWGSTVPGANFDCEGRHWAA